MKLKNETLRSKNQKITPQNSFLSGYLFSQRFPHLGWAIRDELPTVFCCAVRRVFAGKKKLLI